MAIVKCVLGDLAQVYGITNLSFQLYIKNSFIVIMHEGIYL